MYVYKTAGNAPTIYYLGSGYPLITKPLSYPPLYFDGTNFIISKTHESRIAEFVINWYKKQALIFVKGRVDALSNRDGFNCGKIKIGGAKTRWGSCSSKNDLSFTYKLVMAPVSVIDYVVIHELVHTTHHNHAKSFWKEVSKHCPNYKEERKWLRRHGHLLTK
jgi:predicted metal-dependent hydrolase